MNIVYLIHSLHNSGGMERVVSVKASRLAERGHNVCVVTASLRGRKPCFPISDKVRIVDLGTGDSFGPSLMRYRKALKPLLDSLSPDVCISTGGNEMYPLCESEGRFARIVEYHFSRDKFHIKYHFPLFGRLFADFRLRRLTATAALADCLVLLTDSDLADWKAAGLVNTARIYNPVTVADARRSALDSKHMIAVGRLTAQKDYPSMIRIWKMVSQVHPDWSLDIYGEGELRDSLQKQIDDAALGDKVHLCGLVSDIAERMASSEGILMTSAWEGFPLVLVEASACGLPLLSYDCPKGPAEIVQDGENGFLIESGDEDGFAAAVCRLIEDDDLRRRMADAAFDTSLRFAPDAIMSEWERLFEEVCSARL